MTRYNISSKDKWNPKIQSSKLIVGIFFQIKFRYIRYKNESLKSFHNLGLSINKAKFNWLAPFSKWVERVTFCLGTDHHILILGNIKLK